MSADTFVFLHNDRLPTRAQWQEVLDQEQTGVLLGDVDDLRAHSGYLPISLWTKPRALSREPDRRLASGFEWFYGPVADVFGDTPPALGARICTHAAQFVTHGDMTELVSALYAAGALAKAAGGLLYDKESDAFVTGDIAIVQAREIAETEL